MGLQNFIAEHPIVSIFILAILSNYLVKVQTAFQRWVTLLRHGYPPAWSDADGNNDMHKTIKKLPEKVNGTPK